MTEAKTTAQRQAEFKKRMLETGKRRVCYWLSTDEEKIVKQALETGSGMDKATVEVIVQMEREIAKWKGEAMKLRGALDRASGRST